MSKVEQTLSLIKPDAVERNLEEEIKQFFIKSGFIIAKQKSATAYKSVGKTFSSNFWVFPQPDPRAPPSCFPAQRFVLEKCFPSRVSYSS